MNTKEFWNCSPLKGVLFFLLAIFLQRENSGQSFTVKGEWMGARSDSTLYFSSVQVQGSYAYVNAGGGALRVFDISNPAQPKPVSLTATRIGFRFVISGHYLFAPTEKGGFTVVDVTDPTHPYEASHYLPDDGATSGGISVVGNRVYLAKSNGVEILDIAVLSSPQLLGKYTTTASDVRVKGDFAFVATSSALLVLDVSNPAMPTFFASLPLSGFSCEQIQIDGNRVVAMGANINGLAAFRLIDISNPIAPQVLASSVELAGHLSGVFGGSYFYATTSRGLRIFDLNDTVNVSQVGSNTDINNDTDVVVSGHYAYVVSGGLVVMDISDPVHPSIIGGYYPYVQFGSMAMGANYAYFLDTSGRIHSVDISDPTNPKEIAVCLTGYSLGGTLKLSGNRLYRLYGNSTFQVYDTSNPTNLVRLGRRNDGAGGANLPEVGAVVQGFAVAGNLIYALDGRGINVVNASDPSTLSTIGYLNYYAADIKIVDNLAYVAHGGVGIVDISNPQNPVVVNNVQFASTMSSVDAAPPKLFTVDAGSSAGLTVLNASDPIHPYVESRYAGDPAGLVAGSSSLAFIGRGHSLTAVDVRYPGQVSPIGTNYFFGGTLVDLAVKNDLAFALIDNIGLRIYEATPSSQPPPPRPSLAISLIDGKAILQWDDTFSDYKLYGANGFGGTWNLISDSLPHNGSKIVFTNNHPIAPSLFYQLAK